MTRDPFSAAAIADEVEPHTWRRLFGVSAKTIPLREMPSMTSTAPNGMTRDVVAIGVQPAAIGLAGKEHNSVQDCSPCRYRPVTGTQAIALKLLRSVPEPMSAKRVARALQWPEHRAVKWLRFFAGKGLLVARRGPDGGHFWAEGAGK